jgi:hypothetical protein
MWAYWASLDTGSAVELVGLHCFAEAAGLADSQCFVEVAGLADSQCFVEVAGLVGLAVAVERLLAEQN